MIHIPAGAEVSDGTAVQTAIDRFQLVDDLHGAHLGSADQGSGRKGGREQIKSITLRRQFGMDAADYVHDVAVSLNGAVGIDMNAAGPCHAPKIVARQIDQHHVLGILFRVGAQLGLPSQIHGWVIRTWTRSGDRPQLCAAALEFHQGFR